MTTRERLFDVSRISNGWIITICDHWGHSVCERFCATWDEVIAHATETAFPYVDKTEFRGPRP